MFIRTNSVQNVNRITTNMQNRKVMQDSYNWPNKKLSYCWETVRRKSMPRIAEMDVEMTT